MVLLKNKIKKTSTVLFVFSTSICMMIFLCGCPYHTSFTIDKHPLTEIDTNYIGNWKGKLIDELYGNTLPIKINITGTDNFNYNLIISGKFGSSNNKNLIEDTIVATMFVSIINNKQIANIMLDNRVFFADVSYQNDQISFLPLADNFTSFLVKTNTELKYRIAYHFKTRLNPLYDESFCLRNMTRVTGITK